MTDTLLAVPFSPLATAPSSSRVGAGGESRGYLTFAFLLLLYVLYYGYSPLSSARRSLDVGARGLQKEEVEDVGEGSALKMVAGSLIGLTGALLILRRREGGLLPRTVAGGVSMAFVTLLVASNAWSDNPLLSLKRTLVFLALITGAAGIARNWTLREVNLAIVITTASLCGAAILVDMATGAFHPLNSIYRLSGLAHPNAHGRDAALLLMGCITGLYLHPKSKPWLLAGIGLALMALFLSRSRTAIVGGAAGLGMALVLLLPRRHVVIWTMAGLCLVLAVYTFLPDFTDLLKHGANLGRQASEADVESLTGRTYLWQVLFKFVNAKPVLGYGYGGFWSPDRVNEVEASTHWYVAHAHCAYIDATLSFGLVGMPLFVAVSVTSLGTSILRYVRERKAEFAFAAGMLAWYMVNTIAESINPRTNLSSMLVIIVVASVAWTLPGERAILARPKPRRWAP